MKRFFSMASVVLLCGAASFAQYTNVLENGTNQTVNTAWTNDTVWVGQTTSSNTMQVVSGGAVVSTNVYVGATSNANDNVVSVTDGRWDIENTLEIGTGTNNTVSVGSGGTIGVGELIVHSNNTFNIDAGGTLSISGDYDADTQTNVTWASGGTLSVGGTLVKSNGLDGAGRTLVVDGGDWSLGGSLSISGSSNTVTVVSGGRIEADDLIVADGSTFNLGSDGTLAIDGGFNIAQQTNLVWDAGGLLAVSDELSGLPTTNLVANGSTKTYAYINGGHDIALDGGSLQLGTTNLIVGYRSSSSDLYITNGATVENADGYIGWGGSSVNNSVLVSGSGSAWTNNGGDLYVGAYWSGTNLVNAGVGNTLTIENDGWVNVGEVQTNLSGGSMLVASTNGAQLVVGRGTVNVEGTLYLGLDADTTGTSIIRNNGTVSVGDLQVADGSLLELQSGGTFAIAASFDRSMVGFDWNEGGHLSVGGDLSGMEVTNGLYYLEGGRDLTLDGGTWDIGSTNLVVGYNDSGSILTVKNGGLLSSATTSIGWGTNAANNKIVVEEDGVWNNSGDLWVGQGGSGNTLAVSSGGAVDVVDNAYIGNVDASNNTARVTGSNSVWSIAGDLFVGGSSNSVDNGLSVSDSGEVRVGGSLTLHTGNSISLASEGSISLGAAMNIHSNTIVSGVGDIEFGATNATLAFFGDNITLGTGVVFTANFGYDNTVAIYDGTFTVAGTNGLPYENFQTLSLSNSALNGFGLLDTFGTIAMDGGRIDPAGDDIGRLEVKGEFLPDGTTYRAQVVSNQWDELVFSGSSMVDLTNLSADVFVPYIPTATNDIVILSAVNLTNSFSGVNIDVRPLLYDGALLVTNNEVQVVLVPVETGTIGSALDYAGTEGVRAGFGGMKNMVFTRTKQLRRNLVSTAHAIPNEVRLLTTTNTPAGAMGPGDQNTIFDMHIWLQHYSGQGDYDGIGVSEAFKLNNNGTTIGADKLIGEALAVGFNYTYARSAARADNGDRLDSETYWIGAYGEWIGLEGLYVDALVGYGFSSYESERFAESYHGTAAYNGHAFGFSADVGQYYYYGDNLALSPYLGLQALALIEESHRENEDAGSTVRVGEVDHSWLESAFGLKLRHRFDTPVGRFQTTGYAEWTYDFVQDEIYSSMSSGGLAAAETAHISPDESGINAGLGYSWICTDYMEIGVGYNGRFSDNFEEHTGSLMLDIMF